MSQRNPESGPQSPPPPYSAPAITQTPLSSLQYNEAILQCQDTTLEIDKPGINTRQSSYNNEKLNCQCERHARETEELDLLTPKHEICKEDGEWKWETKREDIKRKWATKKADVKQKWEKAKDDMRLKWATRTKGDGAHSYAPLNENVKGSGDRSGPNVISGKNAKSKENVRYTRAALSGNTDTTLLAAMVSVALFASFVF
ncbi:hypothetical protein VC83_01674 [Pseudogymnoascus destructans]|uniref:Uncharacterized protein n=2 Tax=Pseudogymnoascus destructans TaxID=655981 RepID=L8FX64_PSED2|nr:uncharacterized protein VC83_01674 [Pseudogymnoascus destructans]ELR05104.1 hypothetical protein GMDG_07146 [Pseudogymnoascus destructans 20631-21]OAF62097.1 hypothetical protein VC83_01674 [Pseudogymnoascus destructans]